MHIYSRMKPQERYINPEKLKPYLFQLTNEQREYLGLAPLDPSWKKISAKRTEYDTFEVFIYVDETQRIRRVIWYAQCRILLDVYREYEIDAFLTEDGTMLRSKLPNGKPQELTCKNICKRKSTGIVLHLHGTDSYIYNSASDQYFYRVGYDVEGINNVREFVVWADLWCKKMTPAMKAELDEFKTRKKMKQSYKEGDFFRFRINQWEYGYGRIVLDIMQMRRDGTEFWDIFKGNPVCVAIYHILTPDKNVPIEELEKLQSLPAFMMDEKLFINGEIDIIGNRPVDDWPDYPIYYGLPKTPDPHGFRFQRGKYYRSSDTDMALYDHYNDAALCPVLDVNYNVLGNCTYREDNEPYWDHRTDIVNSCDLRHKSNQRALERIILRHRLF